MILLNHAAREQTVVSKRRYFIATAQGSQRDPVRCQMYETHRILQATARTAWLQGSLSILPSDTRVLPQYLDGHCGRLAMWPEPSQFNASVPASSHNVV
jgi:hypothetical protein